MSMIFMDSFDSYGVTADFVKKWTTTNDAANATFDATGGRFGGGALKFLTAGAYLRKNLNDPSTVVCGGYYKVGTIGGIQEDYIYKLNQTGDPSVGCYLKVLVDGSLALYANNDATPKATSSLKMVAGIGYYVEFKATCSDTGLLEVRVNNELWATWSGDTYFGAAGPAFGSVDVLGNGATAWLDDFYVLDDSGGANSDYLGDHRIDLLPVNEDVGAQMFVPSAGTDHYAMVDDASGDDGDATYIQAANVGDKDRFGLADLSGDAASVAAVQLVYRAKKTNAGDRSLQGHVHSGGSTASGAPNVLLTDYVTFIDVHDLDPNTATSWSASAIDALELGIEVV